MLRRRVGRRHTRYRLVPAAARRSLMLIGGRVEAGSNFNVVPDVCTFTVIYARTAAMMLTQS